MTRIRARELTVRIRAGHASSRQLIFALPNLSRAEGRQSAGTVTSAATLFSPFASLAFRIYYRAEPRRKMSGPEELSCRNIPRDGSC